MKFTVLWIAGLMLAATAGQVQAGVITTYTARSTFNAAVGGVLTVEDFTSSDHFPISTGILNAATNLPGIGITPGTIQAGVTYSTPIGSGNFFNIDAGGFYSGGFLDGFNPETRDVTMTFDTPVSAFGFDIGGFDATDFDVTIQFTAGVDQTFNILYPATLQFFGFQSSASDIQSVVIGNNGGSFGFDFDNFTFGGSDAVAVPEPASSAVWVVGAIGAMFARRKRQQMKLAA